MATSCRKPPKEEEIEQTQRRLNEQYPKEMSKRALNKLGGDYFEAIASSVVVNNLGMIVDPGFTPPATGLDLVCRAGPDLVLVEIKESEVGKAKQNVSATKKSGKQLSMVWIANRAAEMQKPKAAKRNPGNAKLGKEIQNILEKNPESLKRVVITGDFVSKNDVTDFVVGVHEIKPEKDRNSKTYSSKDMTTVSEFSGIGLAQPLLDK